MDTYLQLNSASCERIFTCTSDYLEIADIINDENQTKISLAYTEKNKNSLLSANEIRLQDKIYTIDKISSDDDNIYIAVNSQIDFDKKNGNYIEIIK